MNACVRLGLGTVQWGMPYGIANSTGQAAADIDAMLGAAARCGVRLLDTAAAYGTAEDELGRRNVVAQGFAVVTKIGAEISADIDEHDVARVAAAFDASLARLGCGRVHGLMVHRADDLLLSGGDRLWNVLEGFKTQGRVAKVGVSVYTPQQLASILDRFPIDIVQLPFNVYDQRFLRSGLLDRLQAADVEVHARSVFLQGLLLLPPERLPLQFAAIAGHQRAYFDALRASGVGPVAGALCFCLAQPKIDRVIVGCESAAQLGEILEAAENCRGGTRRLEAFALGDEAVINPSRWKR